MPQIAEIQAQTTPTPTAALTEPFVMYLLAVVAGSILVVGLLVILGRWGAGPDKVIVRSWLAISLTTGLLLFSAASLALSDSTLRSMLFGGVVASVGASSAFYFASRSSDQARKDILNASLGMIDVPDLRGSTVSDATQRVAQLPLILQVSPTDAGSDWIVKDQQPAAMNSAQKGSSVSITTIEPDTTTKPKPDTTEPDTTTKPKPDTTEPDTTTKPKPDTTEPA